MDDLLFKIKLKIMKMNDLTFTEEQIMRVIWSLKTAYLKDVMQAHPEPKPHQNTVSTYLKILKEKKFISVKKEGRIFKYKVAISYEDHQTFLIKQFLGKYFGNSSLALILKMIADKILISKDLEQFLSEKKERSAIIKETNEEDPTVADFIKTLTEPKKKKKKKKKKKNS